MLTKDKITKYSAVSIAFAAGVLFTLSGQALYKPKQKDNSIDVVSSAVKVVSTVPAASDVNIHDTVPTAVSTVATKAVSTAATKSEVKVPVAKLELNNYVLKVIPTYKGRKYPYLLNDDYEHYNGVTENIIYKGSLIAKANPDGSKSSHCVGLTYEVFFKAMKLRNKEAGISSDNFNNMSADNMKDFLLTWYAAKGTLKSEGNQLAGAIVKYGLGTQIKKLADAKAGDFIDFSRTKSGHTAVFINWLKDDKGNILGFKYWSTQESTNGIAYREEYFIDNPIGEPKGTVNRNQLYIGRVGAISNYKPF